MRILLLLLLATSMQAQGYFSRFLSHCVLDVNNGVQYRNSTSKVNLDEYFDLRITNSDIQLLESEIGFNIPKGAEEILMDIDIPATGTKTQHFSGFEMVKSVSVGIPYVQASLQWANKGRMEQPSIFASTKVFGLIADLLTDKQKLLTEIALSARPEPIIQGRIDFQIELNMHNIFNYNLKSKSKKKWSFHGNIFPYWITTLDASNTVGILQALDVQPIIEAEVSKLHIPFADDITSIATGIVNNKLFLPTNPFYTGFGAKTLLQLKYKTAFQIGWLVDYSELFNGQKGVKPLRNLSTNLNIKFGL